MVVGVVLLVAAWRWPCCVATPALAAVIATYAATSLAYCFWLKNQPVIDLAIVSSGFLLRATAGGAAAGIALSQWFLLVASFGSLFMVAGKRYSELRLMGADGARDAQVPAGIQRELPALRVVHVGVGRRHDLQPVGLRDDRGRQTAGRGRRSPSRRSCWA